MADWGETVEKNIRYIKKTNSYLVIFNFASINEETAFSNLEDARAYKKAVLEAKLKIKIENTINKLLKNERREILDEPEYPYNLFYAIQNIDPIFEENIDLLFKPLNDREKTFIELFYKEKFTFQKIADNFGITRERARQIINKSIHKLKFYNNNYSLIVNRQYKERLIKEYESTHEYTTEIAEEFGQVVNVPIEDLGLSVRAYHCLKKSFIRDVLELSCKTYDDICKIRNMGIKTAKEIQNKLHELGLKFANE